MLDTTTSEGQGVSRALLASRVPYRCKSGWIDDDVRLGDAHLPSSKLNEAFELLSIDPSRSPMDLGLRMLSSAIDALGTIAEMIEK
ncbi:hypothetical protein GCM10009105_05990 [Dokdonella soli]|uniref:Uncharacterized protein n=1 Tax=Dokdonella soli TaxID=529810 RepID=A0ABN1ICQ3_9GAMM